MKRGSGPSQRTYVWTDRKNFKRYACFKTRNGTGIWLAVFRGKVCPLGCSEKVCIPSPFLRSCQKLGGGGRSHFHVNNSLLVIPFLVFLMLHEDRFCGFVLVARWVYMRSTYIEECCFSSWPETSCPYVQSSLRACDGGSWGWIPHCRSVRGGALHLHPCRLCRAEMWQCSGCHHVFVQQNPPCTTGRGLLWIGLHMWDPMTL